jgi:hypothetical protein
MTTEELRDKGYTAVRNGDRVTVYQNGERVASLSPMMRNGRLGFDWHKANQGHLRSWDIEQLLKEREI